MLSVLCFGSSVFDGMWWDMNVDRSTLSKGMLDVMFKTQAVFVSYRREICVVVSRGIRGPGESPQASPKRPSGSWQSTSERVRK